MATCHSCGNPGQSSPATIEIILSIRQKHYQVVLVVADAMVNPMCTHSLGCATESPWDGGWGSEFHSWIHRKFCMNDLIFLWATTPSRHTHTQKCICCRCRLYCVHQNVSSIMRGRHPHIHIHTAINTLSCSDSGRLASVSSQWVCVCMCVYLCNLLHPIPLGQKTSSSFFHSGLEYIYIYATKTLLWAATTLNRSKDY